jgi:hypothetical protein
LKRHKWTVLQLQAQVVRDNAVLAQQYEFFQKRLGTVEFNKLMFQ